MIVRKLQDGSLILVNQTDHARLCGQFAAHWGNPRFEPPRRRLSLIQAATFHDLGWSRYEVAPIFDMERQTSPTFFEVPNSQRQLAEFKRAIDWLTAIDPYAGLLANMHRTGLWQQRYGAVTLPKPRTRSDLDAEVQAYIRDQEAFQKELASGFDESEIGFDFRLLEFWDVFSLAFCTTEFREAEFDPVPTRYADVGGARVVMRLREGNEVEVSPYPFDQDGLRFGYLRRVLPAARYESEEDFRCAFFGARSEYCEYVFVAGS